MSTLQIRNMPDDVYQILKHRAGKAHRSMAQQAIMDLRKLPELEGRSRRLFALSRIEADFAQGHAARALSVAPEVLLRQDRER